MAERFTLEVESRQVVGKQVRRLRAHGVIPANISGGAKPSVSIQIPAAEMTRLHKRHGAGMLYLQIGKEKNAETAILGRVERDAVTSAVLHVDFRRVRLDEPIHSRVPIHLTGEAPAVKIGGGVLIHLLDTLEIESLPTNIPDAVTLDISSLTELNSQLAVADITLPPKVTLVSAASEPVVTIKPPRIEAPEPETPTTALEAAAGGAAPGGTPGGTPEPTPNAENTGEA